MILLREAGSRVSAARAARESLHLTMLRSPRAAPTPALR